MLIKRLGHCDVRLEVKNFASSVPTKDVDKFERDLLATNAHGILCSLGSKIVQHGDVDMSQLPNGRLAFYLANVGEDVDVVVTFLHVIYKLDAVAGGTPLASSKKMVSSPQKYAIIGSHTYAPPPTNPASACLAESV